MERSVRAKEKEREKERERDSKLELSRTVWIHWLWSLRDLVGNDKTGQKWSSNFFKTIKDRRFMVDFWQPYRVYELSNGLWQWTAIDFSSSATGPLSGPHQIMWINVSRQLASESLSFMQTAVALDSYLGSSLNGSMLPLTIEYRAVRFESRSTFRPVNCDC